MNQEITFLSFLLNKVEYEGHDYIYHLEVQKAARSLGLESYVMLPIGYGALTLPKNWISTFRKTNSAIKRWLDFAKIFRTRSFQRIFFLESFTTKDLILLATAALIFLPKEDRICLLFRYNLEFVRYGGKIHTLLCYLLRKKLDKNFLLLSDSELIARSLQKKWAVTVKVMPIPHGRCQHAKKNGSSNEKIHCWWPGSPREAKGLKEIQRLFSLKDPHVALCEIIVHEQTPLSSTENSLVCKRLNGNLSREEYERQLYQSDIILLPYDPIIYKESTSGIFVEAICAGKMVLVKEGSWLAHELRRFDLGALIVDWENPLFFSHLADLTKNISLKEGLCKMQEDYRKYHSVESFANKLSELLDLN